MSTSEDRARRLDALRREVVEQALAEIPERPARARPRASSALVAAAVALTLGPLWAGGNRERDVHFERGLRLTCRILVENTISRLGS